MEEENAYPKKSVRRSFTTCGTLFGLFPALLLLAFPVVGPILFFFSSYICVSACLVGRCIYRLTETLSFMGKLFHGNDYLRLSRFILPFPFI